MELLCAINHPSPESASIAGEPLSAKQVPPHHGREYFCIIRDDLRRTHRAYRHAHLRNEDGAGPRALGTPTVGLSLGRYSRLTFGGSMTSGGPGLAATDGCCLRRLGFRCLFCRAGPANPRMIVRIRFSFSISISICCSIGAKSIPYDSRDRCSQFAHEGQQPGFSGDGFVSHSAIMRSSRIRLRPNFRIADNPPGAPQGSRFRAQRVHCPSMRRPVGVKPPSTAIT